MCYQLLVVLWLIDWAGYIQVQTPNPALLFAKPNFCPKSMALPPAAVIILLGITYRVRGKQLDCTEYIPSYNRTTDEIYFHLPHLDHNAATTTTTFTSASSFPLVTTSSSGYELHTEFTLLIIRKVVIVKGILCPVQCKASLSKIWNCDSMTVTVYSIADPYKTYPINTAIKQRAEVLL